MVAIFGLDGGFSIFDALDFVLIFETMERDNAASQTRRSGLNIVMVPRTTVSRGAYQGDGATDLSAQRRATRTAHHVRRHGAAGRSFR